MLLGIVLAVAVSALAQAEPCVASGKNGLALLDLPAEPAQRKLMIATRCPHPLKDLVWYPSLDKKHLPPKCPNTFAQLFGGGYYDDPINVNRFIVASIAAERFGAVSGHDGTRLGACDDKNKQYMEDQANYVVSAQKDGVHLGLALDVQARPMHVDPAILHKFHGDPFRLATMFDAVARCVNRIEAEWGRYGVHLDLAVAFGQDGHAPPQDAPYPVNTVNLLDVYGGPDSLNWKFGGPHDEPDYKPCVERCLQTFDEMPVVQHCIEGKCLLPKEDPLFCWVLMHETGHNMTLDDEYREARCPDRPLIAKEPGGIMAHPGQPPWFFLPRHVLQVLEPLCQ